MEKRYTLRLLIFIGLCISYSPSLFAKADALKVSIHYAVLEGIPDFGERISRVLSSAEIPFEMMSYPPARSLELLKQGKIGLEFFRTPYVMGGVANLEKLEPAVNELEFKMFTSTQTSHFCHSKPSDFKSMSVAGLRGILLHEQYFYPKFAKNNTLVNVRSLFKFVSLQRANVGFAPQPLIDKAREDSVHGFVVCDRNEKVFYFYGYLHRDFLWAKEAIEKHLIEEFGL